MKSVEQKMKIDVYKYPLIRRKGKNYSLRKFKSSKRVNDLTDTVFGLSRNLMDSFYFAPIFLFFFK